MILFIFINFAIFCASVSSQSNLSDEEKLLYNRVEVCAKCGCVRGKVEKGRIEPYDAFYSIPYAEPPIGKLRFENPVPYKGWDRFWDATYSRDACIQRNTFKYSHSIFGSEDCLYLNVYRPSTWDEDKKLPVLVFIHGGSWLDFSSHPKNFGPEYLMDNGEVIVVTFNYRLGLFGLLCSGDEAVKGNFALKDQQLALKWVKNYIEDFGGDANSITLAGHSAGAASVHLHMMNPSSQALFHRVILMSGTAINPWCYLKDFKSQFRQAAKFVGLTDWENASTYDLAKEMKNVDALSLVEAVDGFFLFQLTPPYPLGPCIEGDWKDAFLKEDPRIIWAEGNYAPKPILIGTTSDEGLLGAGVASNGALLAAFNKKMHYYLPIVFSFNPKYASDVLKFYLGDEDEADQRNLKEVFKMGKDRLFLYPMIVFVNQFLKTTDVKTNPIYIYEFAFKSKYTFLKYLTGLNLNLGVCHMDDLFYLFTMSDFFPIFNTSSAEGKMVDVFVRTIVNFATRGEVKKWRKFKPCTTDASFCDRQIFQRYDKLDPNQVEVSISDEIDEEMVSLWTRIDKGSRDLND